MLDTTHIHMTTSARGAREEFFSKSDLYFVRYGQLFEHLDYWSRRGNEKLRNFSIVDVNKDFVCFFSDHATTAIDSWYYGTTTFSDGLG